jgi:uncharacterized protein involved in response to NO
MPAPRRSAFAPDLRTSGLVRAPAFLPFFAAAPASAVLAAVPFCWPGAAPPVVLASHGREALFGYAAAVLAGFLLTALPCWTGRPPVPGGVRHGILALWLFGRAASTGSAELAALAPTTDALAAALLAAAALVCVVAGRSAKNLKTALVVALYAGAAWWAALRAGAGLDLAPALRGATASLVLLLVIVGGRITPGLTKAWLVARGRTDLPVWFGRLDLAANLVTAGALAAWVAAPASLAAGSALLAGAILQAMRLARWRGSAVAGAPGLLGLHLGYAFVPLGLAAAALAALAPGAFAPDAPLHAWTIGAFGLTACAVMSRAIEGHLGAPRRARALLSIALACIASAAALRLGAGMREAAPFLIPLAGALWTAGQLAFLAGYGPALLSRARA